MSRRKGTPCACNTDPCSCGSSRNCVRAVNNVSPDPNGDLVIRGGTGIEVNQSGDDLVINNTANPNAFVAGNNIELNQVGDDIAIDLVDEPVINGTLTVNGDIIQNGAAYETHAEKIYTRDDYIIMRDGAIAALAPGDYAGFQVKLYDGVNDGRLVIDNSGTARVGDVGDEEPLLTRDESSDLTNGALFKWDATNFKAINEGTVGSDTKPIKIVNGVATAVTNNLALDSAVVHKTGNEFIAGSKTFQVIGNDTTMNAMRPLTTGTPASSEVRPIYTIYNADASVRHANIYIQKETNGILSLNVELRKNDGTYKYVRLADSS